MSVEDADAIIKSIIGVAGAVGGLFFILRMAVAYQRDFTDQYARRVQDQDAHIKRQDQRIDVLEAEIDGLHKARADCHQENARMRLALINAGIDLPPP